ncbi:hypothetical protein [Candidatus Electronema sp. PJ]|uniref:hypothetical protein n=1 Tax=Candidatus Electronema sp. PJ TaxID=3401572 RepID=UPI003AA809D0
MMKTVNDPIIEELRRYRTEHSEKFGYDLDAICEDYKRHQREVGERLIRLPPKRIDKAMPQEKCSKDSLADR